MNNKISLNRFTATADPEAVLLPASLAYQLVNTLHLLSEEVALLSLEQAMAKMTEHWAQSGVPSQLPHSATRSNDPAERLMRSHKLKFG